MKKILVIAAHPDDEILGCGATMAKYIDDGCDVRTLILGEGVTSRNIGKKHAKKQIMELKKCALKANEILGTKEVIFKSLPDNQFDTVPFLSIVKKIEEVLSDFKADTIFTHHNKDLNIDHRITYQAVLTACRPIGSLYIKDILCFEILSSTEQSYPLSFSPNVFSDVRGYLNRKLKALSCYASEMRDFPHPRSLRGVEINSLYRGMQIGVECAEAFELCRKIL